MDAKVIELKEKLKYMTRSRNAYRGLYRRQKRISRGFCEMAMFMARENLDRDKEQEKEQRRSIGDMSDDEYDTSTTEDDEMIDMTEFEQNARREEYLGKVTK